MDGNGRWAKKRKKPRTTGHREGLKTAKLIAGAAVNAGIKYITLYTFSTENWKRAEEEVSFLMKLVGQHLKKEMDFYRKNKIRVRHTGDITYLPEDVQREILQVLNDTSEFDRMTINLAINYGGRNEIIRAVNKFISGGSAAEMSERDLVNNLDCPDLPDPDLIIRTGGEKRLSNFLLWQSAYSELYFSSKLWPDWSEKDLYEAIHDYQNRDRKFGGVT